MPETSLPVGRPKVSGTVLVHLRALVRQLAEAGETRLPAERDLALRFAVSRPTLRQALEALQDEGVLWRHVGRGTFIAPQENRVMLTLPPLSVAMTDVVAVRLALEPAAAEAAARRRDPAALRDLAEAAARTRAATSWRDYEVADTEFHLALAKAAGNPVLVALIETVEVIRRGSHLARDRTTAAPAQDHPSFAEHDAILNAVGQGDAAAARAAAAMHLQAVEARFTADPPVGAILA